MPFSFASRPHETVLGAAPSGPAALTFATEPDEAHGAIVVRLTGEIDYDTAPALRAAFDDALRANPGVRLVVVDLGGVPFVDSQGLAELIRVHQRITAADGELRLASASGAVNALLTVTATGDLLGHRPTVTEALTGSSVPD